MERSGKAGRGVVDQARDRAAEATTATRRAATSADGGTNVMGAVREAREQASGTPATAGAAGAAVSSRADDRINGMVLRGLKADQELKSLGIDVDSRDGVVTLSGAVPSAAARARAAEIARDVKDVRSVNDQLTLNAS